MICIQFAHGSLYIPAFYVIWIPCSYAEKIWRTNILYNTLKYGITSHGNNNVVNYISKYSIPVQQNGFDK